MRPAIWLVLLALAGCADLSPQPRWLNAERLAAASGWKKVRLPADNFVLAGYMPESIKDSDTLTIYIEGDGMAWISESAPSDDPTPRKPVGLELALRHPRGAAVYLARPCQFVEGADAHGCTEVYWTNRRFAPEVVAATSQAIDELKQRFHARQLALVGYSGGGAVAALVAVRRKDVSLLVTVAGNLDHRAWTRQHHVSPLAGSLNPADEWEALLPVPQIHFAGGRDHIVGTEIAESYLAHFPAGRHPEMRVIADFDHACCWAERWPALVNQMFR